MHWLAQPLPRPLPAGAERGDIQMHLPAAAESADVQMQSARQYLCTCGHFALVNPSFAFCLCTSRTKSAKSFLCTFSFCLCTSRTLVRDSPELLQALVSAAAFAVGFVAL